MLVKFWFFLSYLITIYFNKKLEFQTKDKRDQILAFKTRHRLNRLACSSVSGLPLWTFYSHLPFGTNMNTLFNVSIKFWSVAN